MQRRGSWKHRCQCMPAPQRENRRRHPPPAKTGRGGGSGHLSGSEHVFQGRPATYTYGHPAASRLTPGAAWQFGACAAIGAAKTANAGRKTPATTLQWCACSVVWHVLREGDEVALPPPARFARFSRIWPARPPKSPEAAFARCSLDGPDDPRGEPPLVPEQQVRVCSTMPSTPRRRRRRRGWGWIWRTASSDVTSSLARCTPAWKSCRRTSLRELVALFAGEFADDLWKRTAIPQFASWLGAQRRLFRTWHAAALEQLAARVSEDNPADSL